MDLKNKINEDLKSALKEGDKVRLETVRSIRALILEFEKSGKGKDLTPEVEIELLTSAAKKRKEAIEQFAKAGRNELAEKEEKELAIIETYLPKQLSPDEVAAKVKEIAEAIGVVSKTEIGKLMPAAIKQLKGQADGKSIREAAEKILA